MFTFGTSIDMSEFFYMTGPRIMCPHYIHVFLWGGGGGGGKM